MHAFSCISSNINTTDISTNANNKKNFSMVWRHTSYINGWFIHTSELNILLQYWCQLVFDLWTIAIRLYSEWIENSLNQTNPLIKYLIKIYFTTFLIEWYLICLIQCNLNSLWTQRYCLKIKTQCTTDFYHNPIPVHYCDNDSNKINSIYAENNLNRCAIWDW